MDINYQIGDYTSFRGKEIVKITGLSEYHLDLITKDNVPLFGVHYSDVIPLDIKEDMLESCGFKIMSRIKYMLHDKCLYKLVLNNKIPFYITGIVYLNKSIWVSSGRTLHKMHHLQSFIKLIDPTYKIILF